MRRVYFSVLRQECHFEIFVIISTNSKQRAFKILLIIRFFNVYLLLKQKSHCQRQTLCLLRINRYKLILSCFSVRACFSLPLSIFIVHADKYSSHKLAFFNLQPSTSKSWAFLAMTSVRNILQKDYYNNLSCSSKNYGTVLVLRFFSLGNSRILSNFRSIASVFLSNENSDSRFQYNILFYFF